MPSVRFNIEKRRDESGEVMTKNIPILFSFAWDSKRIRQPVGIRIDAKYWNPKKQRVRAGWTGYQVINKSLDELQTEFMRVYWEARRAGIWPSYQYIRENVYIFKKKPFDFFEIYDKFISEDLKLKSESSQKKHRSLYNHLKEFSAKKKFKLEFEAINRGFYRRFVDYLLFDKGMINTTVQKYTGILKWFLKWTIQNGYNKNRDYKDFAPPSQGVRGIAANKVILHLQEFKDIYAVDLPDHLDQIRDGFCLMCVTGIRFSDLKNLKHKDIDFEKDLINIVTVKTGDKLQIPLNDYSRAILKKWGDWPINALPVVSNQKFNEALKKIGKAAGLNEQITIIGFRGAKRLEEVKAKHEILSCHAGRRSFITIALSLGVPAEVIMDITGHKTHKIMEEYYKIFDDHKKAEMQKFN